MNMFDIDTPALLIDLEAMEHNMALMSAYFQGLAQRGSKCRLRPNVKTHKTPILAHKELAAGYTTGITCAKLGEAEVMALSGIRDILIANQIVGPYKISRLINLARHADLKLAVDDAQNVADLSEAACAKGVQLAILVEVNTGLNRCGLAPGEAALHMAQLVDRSPGLAFVGLQGYEGHCVNIPDREERVARVHQALSPVLDSRRLIEASGLEVKLVSSGATSTYNITAEMEGIDEIQAGSYLLMDVWYERLTPEFRCAVTALATVVSRPHPQRIILDVGMKGMTLDHGMPRVKGLDGVRELRFAEEHGIIELEQPSRIQVGDKLELIPSHVCTTVNLYDRFHAISRGQVEAIWPIAARGCSQ
jgi:D-serine deaminase-like pyridoxal phosphate-dependent protein